LSGSNPNNTIELGCRNKSQDKSQSEMQHEAVRKQSDPSPNVGSAIRKYCSMDQQAIGMRSGKVFECMNPENPRECWMVISSGSQVFVAKRLHAFASNELVFEDTDPTGSCFSLSKSGSNPTCRLAARNLDQKMAIMLELGSGPKPQTPHQTPTQPSSGEISRSLQRQSKTLSPRTGTPPVMPANPHPRRWDAGSVIDVLSNQNVLDCFVAFCSRKDSLDPEAKLMFEVHNFRSRCRQANSAEELEVFGEETHTTLFANRQPSDYGLDSGMVEKVKGQIEEHMVSRSSFDGMRIVVAGNIATHASWEAFVKTNNITFPAPKQGRRKGGSEIVMESSAIPKSGSCDGGMADQASASPSSEKMSRRKSQKFSSSKMKKDGASIPVKGSQVKKPKIGRLFGSTTKSKQGQVFGLSLEALVEKEKADNPFVQYPSFAQKVLQEIRNRGKDVCGIYRISAEHSLIETLKNKLDSGAAYDLATEDIHTLTGIFKTFLRELPEPLLTFDLHDEFMGAGEDVGKLRVAVKKLPVINLALLHDLMKHLNDLSDHADKTNMGVSNLAIVIAPNILWCDSHQDPLAALSYMQVLTKNVEVMIGGFHDVWAVQGRSMTLVRQETKGRSLCKLSATLHMGSDDTKQSITRKLFHSYCSTDDKMLRLEEFLLFLSDLCQSEDQDMPPPEAISSLTEQASTISFVQFWGWWISVYPTYDVTT